MKIKNSDHFFTVSDVTVEKSKYKKDEVLLKIQVKSNSSDRMIEVEVFNRNKVQSVTGNLIQVMDLHKKIKEPEKKADKNKSNINIK